MEENRPPEIAPSREEQVRSFGFDPQHLTPQEQEELVEIYLRCPDEVAAA